MSKGDDLQFLKEDIDDEYNEAEAAVPVSNASLFEGEEERTWSSQLKKCSWFKESKHPGVACFHLLFKALAITVYVLTSSSTSNFVVMCVICILLLAFDFWTVKNVSGRLLVGLRWWNYVREDGTTEWVFESIDDVSQIGAVDRRLFWVGLYTPAVIWSLFLVVAILRFEVTWLIVIIAALMLTFANIVGYTKCSKEASQRLEKFGPGSVADNIANTIRVSNLISSIGSMVGGGQQQPVAQSTMAV